MNIAIIRHSIRNRGSDNAIFDYADYLIKKGHQVFYYTNEIQTDLSYNRSIHFQKIPSLDPFTGVQCRKQLFPHQIGNLIEISLAGFTQEICSFVLSNWLKL